MNLKKVKPKPNLLCTNRNIVRFEDFTGVLQLGITSSFVHGNIAVATTYFN